jgi:hypothetical protein
MLLRKTISGIHRIPEQRDETDQILELGTVTLSPEHGVKPDLVIKFRQLQPDHELLRPIQGTLGIEDPKKAVDAVCVSHL